MGRVLPNCKANGAGLGFKNPTCSGFGSGAGIMHTRPELDLYTYIILKKFKNPKYKYCSNFLVSLSLTLITLLAASLSLTLNCPHFHFLIESQLKNDPNHHFCDVFIWRGLV